MAPAETIDFRVQYLSKSRAPDLETFVQRVTDYLGDARLAFGTPKTFPKDDDGLELRVGIVYAVPARTSETRAEQEVFGERLKQVCAQLPDFFVQNDISVITVMYSNEN